MGDFIGQFIDYKCDDAKYVKQVDSGLGDNIYKLPISVYQSSNVFCLVRFKVVWAGWVSLAKDLSGACDCVKLMFGF